MMNNPFALDDKQSASRSTRTYAIMALCVLPLSLIIRINAGLPVTGLWYFSLALAALTFFISNKYTRMPVKYSSILMMCIIIFTLLPSSETADISAEKNLQITYFETYKITAVVIAMLAPFPHFVGYLSLALCLFIPPLQVLLLSREVMQVPRLHEPWITMCYALAAFLVLHHRLGTLKLHATLIESQAKEKNLRDFAEVALALRDLTNTPLQSLDLLIDLLRHEKISQQHASELLSKTTYRLRELMQVLSDQQKKITQKQIRQSMDSMAILRQSFGINSQNEDK